MTLQDRYIQKISSDLGVVEGNNSYSFPCPFCKHLPTSTGKIKLQARKACFIPHKDCQYEYVFYCSRKGSNTCTGEGKSGGMGFLNFLFRYNPYLAEQYKSERRNDPSNTLPFDFKPTFHKEKTHGL